MSLVVNVYTPLHPLFMMIIDSFIPVSVAITSPLVRLHDVGVYSIVAVGGVLSIHVTSASTSPVFPTRSSNVNKKVPFPVKRYCTSLSPVIVSLNPVMIARTSPLVRLHEIG